MKTLLIFSVILNAVLLFLTLRPSGPAPIPARTVRETSLAVSTATATKEPATEPRPANPWKAMGDGDHRRSIQILREIGCPEETIRDLVLIQLGREYLPRMTVLMEAAHKRAEWWRPLETSTEEWRRNWETDQLGYEKAAHAAALLGVPYEEMTAAIFAGLPRIRDQWVSREKEQALTTLRRRLEQEIHDLAGPPIDGEILLDPDQLQAISEAIKRQRAGLTRLLTPAELADYDTHQSDAAEYTRLSLPEAKSEGQFHAMVAAVQASGIARIGNQMRWLTDNDDAERKDLDEKIKRIIGEQRVAAEEKEQAAEDKQQNAARKAEREQADRDRVVKIGESQGIEPKRVQQFMERMEAKFKEIRTAYPKATKLDAKQRKEMETQMRAEMERIAVETMGAAGPKFLKKLMPDEP